MLGDECAHAVSQPNNILALEYIKAIKTLALPLDVVIIKRVGAGYKSLDVSPFPSAMLIRDRIYSNGDIKGLVPEECYRLYMEYTLNGDYCNRVAFLSHMHFALLQKEDTVLCECVGSVELAHRIKRALLESDNLESAVSKAITTRFTRARVMRALLSALFGIPHNAYMHEVPAYTQLLAFSERARPFLSSRRRADFPIITKNADTTEYEKDPAFLRQWDMESMADRFWALSCNTPRNANYFMKRSPFFLK